MQPYDSNQLIEFSKEYIKRVADIITRSDGQRSGASFVYLCPFHSEKTPSFSVTPEKGVFYCFGCGTGGDVFKMIALDRNLNIKSDFRQVVGIAEELTGAKIGMAPYGDYTPKQRRNDDGIGEPELLADLDLTAESIEAHENLSKHPEAIQHYLDRGFTIETIKRFRLGYDVSSMHFLRYHAELQKKNSPPVYKYVLPFLDPGGRCYYAMFEIDQRCEEFRKYEKPKTITQPVYREHYLTTDTPDVLFVVEGIYDALSVEQSGGHAVALGGTTSKRFLALCKKYRPKTCVAVSLDNDGKPETANAVKRLCAGLDALHIPYIKRPPHRKDFNEDLCADPDGLKAYITEAIETAQKAVHAQKVQEVEKPKEVQEETSTQKVQETTDGAIAFDGVIGEPDDVMPQVLPAEEEKSLLKNEPVRFSAQIRTLTLDYFKNEMKPRNPELIEGVLRQGHKMLITGASKTGKSFLAIQLGIAVATGGTWLGFKCQKGRVLYLNCEVHEASFEHRVCRICEALDADPATNFDVIHMRGHTKPLEEIANDILADAESFSIYSTIIIDPIYKILSGDENSASDMGRFVKGFDRICEATGAACVYVHHHTKGSAGTKKAADRMSGSGVFARDPDAILDVSELELTDGMKAVNDNDGLPLRVEFVLREFESPKPVDMWFRYPVHVLDADGALKDLGIQGSPIGNLAKTGKMSTDYEQLEQIRMCFEERAAFEDAAESGIHLNVIASMICPVKPGQSNDRRIENGKRKIQYWFKHNELLQTEFTLRRATVFPNTEDTEIETEETKYENARTEK